MGNQIYTISVDWFQVSCKRDTRNILQEGMYIYGTATTDNGRELCYKLTQPREFNAIFEHCLSVELHGFRLATIYFQPRPSTISPSLCMVKMANPVLYSSRWQWYLADILAALKWQYRAISRIDLCCDFNYFSGGLAPVDFIRDYLRGGAWDPSVRSYYRVNGNKYCIIGNKVQQTTEVKGCNVGGTAHNVEYLRFGQHKSGVAVYLYNKTLELNQSGRKVYIRDHWARVGLEDTTECPVYRLEISINASATSVKVKKDIDTNNEQTEARGMYERNLKGWSVRSLAFDDFGTQQAIENVFWAYASHYFRFKIVGPQTHSCNWSDAVLFDVTFVNSMKPYRVTIPLDSGVSERNAANHLERLLYATDSLSIEERVSLDNAIHILRKLKGLKESTFSPEVLEKARTGLLAGWSWEEFIRRRVIPRRVLDLLRERIENAATRELDFLKRDANILRSITELDATFQMIKEDYRSLEV